MLASSFIERLSAAGPALLPVLVDGAAKGLAVLGVTALAARAMRRASAASRHLVWFLGAISLLALPILSLALPEWRVLPAWAATQAVVVSPPVVQTPVEIQKTTAQEMPVVPAKENYSNEWENSGAKPQAATITQAPAQAVTTPRAIAPVRRTLHVTWQAWVLMGWLAGTGLMLGYIALGLLSLWWLQRRSARITQGPASDLLRELSARLGLRSGILLLSSPRRTMPMTWGLRRTRILLPADADEWSPDQLRAVLLHELAHVRRHDCLTQLLVQFALAAYWFNPLLWLAWRRMQTEREQACDDLVLSTGAKPSAYAEQLLHIAAEMPATRFSAAAIAMARPSKLEGRLLAILDVRRNRRRLTGIALLAAAALGLCIVLPIAMLRGQTKTPANSQGRAQSVSVVAKPPAGFGKVVDVNGHPVAGAKLQSVETTWSAPSDADGLFKLPEIQNGKPERMNLTAPDFVERENVDLWRNSAGSMPNDGIFELHRFGRVEGKILGPDGQPLAGASYLVNTQQKYQSDSLMTANAFSGVTNAQGRFVIEKVTPGDLLLCYPSEEPNTSTPIKGIKSVIPLTLHDGEILRDVMLDLSKSIAAAEGRVVDKEGKPLREAKVFLCWKTSAATSGAEMDPVFTGADGRYRLEKLPQGPWHLMASIDEASSDSVAVQLSEKPASVPDFVLPVVQTASGRIRRVQPMDAEQTVREWIDATLAKDTQGVAAVVEADSPISRHGDRISLLLVQIKRFPEGSYWSDNEIEKATEKTNELDLGGGRKVQIKFLLAKQSGQWRIFDVVDDKGTSLVADVAGGATTTASIHEPPGGRLVDDPVEAVKKVLPEGMVVQKVVRGTYPTHLEQGKGLGIFIGRTPEELAREPQKKDESLIVWIMPPDYPHEQRPPASRSKTVPQVEPAKWAATTPQGKIFVWGDEELAKKVVAALIVQVDAPATMPVGPATQPAQAESWGWLRTEFQEMSIEPKPILLQYRIIQPKPILVNQAPTFALEVKNVSGKPLKFAECGLIQMRVAGFGMCADPRTSVLPKYTQRGVADMKQSPPIQPDQTVVFDVVYPEPLSKTGRYQVECTVLPPPNNRDVPSDEYCPCPPVVLEVMEAGQTEPPEQDPTQWPDGAWGEAIEKMQIRLDPVQSFLNPGAAAACLMLDARNFGKRDMTLSIPSESIELEFDGVWYHTTDADMGRPPKVYPFGPGNRWQGLQLAPSAQEGWRDSDNKKLANPLGKHTVRLAVTLQPAADGGKPVRLITNAIEFHPADAAPPATEPAAVQPVEQSLPIASKEHPNEGLRLESVPADQAKPGLCAVGPYDKSDMPARPLLYDMAIKGRVANGPNELIGRLHGGDLGTPIKIMKFTRKGHELEILVALSPKKSEGSSYIWGELPRNLPAGRYHVRLTGLEFEERDGQLVPAPKDDIRIFYQLECYFVVGGTPEQDAAWKREGDVVEKAFQQLAERLKFLETDFPRNKLDDQPELFHDETQRTALGEVTSCGIQFQYNWDLGVPRKSPEPGTSGLAVFVDAYRDAPYEDREAFSLINGPVVWDGHTVRREYALDKKEFGWRVHVYVEGNQPEFVKKVNAVIDEDLTQLWKLRAQGALAAPATRHAATQTSVQVADPLAAVVKPFTDDPHPYWAYPDVVSVREIPIDHLAATEIVLKHTQWDLKNEAQSASTDDTIHHPPSPSQAAYYNQIDNYIELWAVRGQVNDAMALKGLLHPTDKPHQWARREIYCLGSENGLSWYGYMPADDFGRFERAHPMHGEPLIPALIRGECKWLLPLEGSAALPDLDRAIADKNPKRKFLVMWMCDSTDPAVTPWLIELTHSRDAEVASGAKEGLVDRPRPQAAELYVRWLSEDIANPSESTMETSLVAACRKIRAAGAAALLPKILAAPRDIWEYREALEFSHELAGQPAMPEALVTAEKTIEEFGNSYADNYDAQKVRQAVEVIAGAHDVDAAAAVGTQLALLHYKGSSDSLNNAGIEILRRLPDGAGEKLVQRIAKRDQRDLGELKVILNALGSEPTGGAASQPTTTHADAPVASPEPMIQPAPWQPATDASKKLIKACKSGTAEQVTAAIQAGAEVNAHDDYGQTPVMVAAAHNEHPEVIALLVKSGADVNAMTKDGMTVLMFAARESQNSDVIAALVKAGADVNAKNVAGQTALDIARAVKNSQAEAALLKSGAKEK